MEAVLKDFRSAPISEREKALFAYLEKMNAASNQLRQEDVDRVLEAGWSSEALYDAITVCALFNFFNKWIDATGVQDMTPDAYQASGERMAENGYIRD